MPLPTIIVPTIKPRDVLYFVGIDPSLTATGVSVLKYTLDKVTLWSSVVPDIGSNYDMSQRLSALYDGIEAAINPRKFAQGSHVVIGMENLAYGVKFGRETSGMVHAVARLAVYQQLAGRIPHLYTPGQLKATIVPDWPGLNLKNWSAAGKTTKFKSSLPDKAAVMSAMNTRFGLKFFDDNLADASAISLVMAITSRLPLARGRVRLVDRTSPEFNDR